MGHIGVVVPGSQAVGVRAGGEEEEEEAGMGVGSLMDMVTAKMMDMMVQGVRLFG